MEKQKRYDIMYMDIAIRVSQESFSTRTKVGAVLVKDDNIISFGWNGMPAGDNNVCELPDGTTNQMVMHSESNTLLKLAAHGGSGAKGATLYCTTSPCIECTKLILQAKIARVVYNQVYRVNSGIEELRSRGVIVEQLSLGEEY